MTKCAGFFFSGLELLFFSACLRFFLFLRRNHGPKPLSPNFRAEKTIYFFFGHKKIRKIAFHSIPSLKIDQKIRTKFEFRSQFCRSQGPPVFVLSHLVEEQCVDFSMTPNCLYKNMILRIYMAFLQVQAWPDGRAERRGTPQLQTKLDPNCLYENMILCIYMAFPQVQGWPDGRAERRGMPQLQTKLDQLCL